MYTLEGDNFILFFRAKFIPIFFRVQKIYANVQVGRRSAGGGPNAVCDPRVAHHWRRGRIKQGGRKVSWRVEEEQKVEKRLSEMEKKIQGNLEKREESGKKEK